MKLVLGPCHEEMVMILSITVAWNRNQILVRIIKNLQDYLTCHWHGFHIGDRAHSSDRARQSFFDLLQRSSSSFWDECYYEYQSNDANKSEHPESTTFTKSRCNVLEGLGHYERAEPVETSDNTRCRSSNFRRQDFTHHQPGDWSKTQRESNHVDDHAGQGDPTVRLDIKTMVFEVEESTQGKEVHDHGGATHVEEDFATAAIYQGSCHERR